jgi:hypothetical protein
MTFSLMTFSMTTLNITIKNDTHIITTLSIRIRTIMTSCLVLSVVNVKC